MPQTVCLTANTDWFLYNFKRPLVASLRARGHDVVCVCSATKYTDALAEETGCRVETIGSYVKQVAPWHDMRLAAEYFGLYRRLRPALVHNFTIKPVIYGAMAARMARVPTIVNTVTGLGYVFTGGDGGRSLLGNIIKPLYRLSGSATDHVFVLNEDDRRFFTDGGLIDPSKLCIIHGEGVDSTRFSPDQVQQEDVEALRSELGCEADAPVILLVARMLYDKGVAEYVEAARTLRERFPSALFLLVGPTAPGNPAMIPAETLDAWDAEPGIRYLGKRYDIETLLSLSSFAVLPSYREGKPQFIMEAMMMGRAVVAADAPGSRELVTHGETGLMVPARNADALAEAMAELLAAPHRAQTFGSTGRDTAMATLSSEVITEQVMRCYGELNPQL